MGLALLLLPAVGGYWFLTHWNYTRYQAVRDSGYHVLFRSALFGILLYCVARGITLLSDWLCPPLTLLWDSHVPEPFTSEVMLSLFLGWLSPFGFNLFFSTGAGIVKVAWDSGDHFEILVVEAAIERKPVELTLRSRKVYIGVPLSPPIGSSVAPYVVLLPLYSGYRNETTLDLERPINYRPVLEKYQVDISQDYTEVYEGEDEARRTSQDFRVVVPIAEVVSARLFDLEVFETFQPEGAEQSSRE